MVDFGLNYDALVNAREEAKRGNEESPTIGDFIKTISSKFSQLGSEIKNNTREILNKENKKVESKLIESEKRTKEFKNRTLSELSDLNSKYKVINETTLSLLNKITEYFKEDKSELLANKNNESINSSLNGINNLTKMVTGIQKESFKDVKKHISNSLSKVHSSILINQKSANMDSIDFMKTNMRSIKETLIKKNIGIEKKIISNSKHLSKISKPVNLIKSGLMGFVNWITSPFKKMLGLVIKLWNFVKFARVVLPVMAFMLSPPGLILMGGLLIAALIYSPKFREFMLGIVDWAFEKISDVIDKFLPEPIANVLNFLLETGYEAIKGLIGFLGELSDNWDNPLWWLEKLQGLGNWIIDKVIGWGDVLVTNIIKPVKDFIFSLLPKPVTDVLNFLGRKFNEGLEGLFTFFFELKDNWDSPTWWFEKFDGMGKWMLESFLEYGDLLLNLGGYIRDSIVEYIPGLKPFFTFWDDTFQTSIQGVVNFLSELPDNWSKPSWWLEKLQGLGDFIIDRFMEWGNILKDGLFSLLDMIPGVDKARAAVYDAASSIGVALNLRESESERREKFSKLSKSEDIKNAAKMFDTSIAKLKLIEAFSAGYDKGQALSLISSDVAKYTSDAHIKYAVDNLASNIWDKGLQWSTAMSFIYPPMLDGMDIATYRDMALNITNNNGRKQLNSIVESIIDNLSSAGLSGLPIGPNKGEDIVIPPVTGFYMGGVVTKPTHAFIGEAGDNEAVIPLNDQGVQFMKDTIVSALKEIKVENPRAIEATEKDNSIENKLDGLTSTITDLVKSINSSMSNSKSRVEAVGEQPPDPLNEFTKMIASGVLSNRRGGI